MTKTTDANDSHMSEILKLNVGVLQLTRIKGSIKLAKAANASPEFQSAA